MRCSLPERTPVPRSVPRLPEARRPVRSGQRPLPRARGGSHPGGRRARRSRHDTERIGPWSPAGAPVWDVATSSASRPKRRLQTATQAVPRRRGHAGGDHVHLGNDGPAKGAVLSHGDLAANGTCCRRVALTALDRYLSVLPLFHVHGLGNGSWLASGCRMRLVERFEHDQARRVRRVPADALLRCADDVRAPPRGPRRRGAWRERATLRFGLGAVARDGVRRLSTALGTRSSSATA